MHEFEKHVSEVFQLPFRRRINMVLCFLTSIEQGGTRDFLTLACHSILQSALVDWLCSAFWRPWFSIDGNIMTTFF